MGQGLVTTYFFRIFICCKNNKIIKYENNNDLLY